MDHVAVATTPVRGWMRRSAAAASISPLDPAAVGYAQAGELGRVARELGQLRLLRHQSGASAANIIHVEHHLSHAASAFFLSPFERALVLTMDEDGDGKSGMIAIGEGSRLRKLRDIRYPHSLAWLFSQITELLGFVPHADEHKTQWLGLGSEPLYRDVFRDMLRKSGSGSLRLDSSYLASRSGRALRSFFQVLAKDGPAAQARRTHRGTAPRPRRHRAAGLRRESRRDHRCSCAASTASHDVCLGGGLFNNTLLVSALEQSVGLDHVFVPPAPGNSGTALGAALYLQHHGAAIGHAKRSASIPIGGPPIRGTKSKTCSTTARRASRSR